MNEFLIDKRRMRRAFSRAAADYDAAAVLQREVCVRMLERLDYIRLQPSRILDAGSAEPTELAAMLPRIPAGHVGRVEDAVTAARFLLSDEAAYVTGTNIHVSGGWGL